MACSKKPNSSSQKTCSHIKNGKSYFKNTGRYTEITKAGAALLRNGAPEVPTLNGDGAQDQNLVVKGINNSLKNAFKELGFS